MTAMIQKWDPWQAGSYGAFLGALLNTVGTFGDWTYDIFPERIGTFVWFTVVCAVSFAAVAIIGNLVEVLFTRLASIGDSARRSSNSRTWTFR
jgi:hypothetical protein